MSSESFYAELPSFADFYQITEASLFKAVPEDWMVFITDVKGSTKAIEDGRYKDVNTVGAAAIVCAQNAMNGLDFPFVFGGDGATLLVPPSQVDAVKRELSLLKSLAHSQFQLDLRVGVVSVKELIDQNSVVEVAKFEFVKGKAVSIFRGGGLSVAERKIKVEPEKYGLEGAPQSSANLNGLSCRWQPIKSKNGMILSMMVSCRQGGRAETYQKVLRRFEKVFDGQIEKANPVNLSALNYKSIHQCYKEERRYHQSRWSWSFLFRMIEIFLAVTIFKFKVPPLFFNPKKYTDSMKTHSDYRKFDDMLRMIVDCSPEQRQEIEEFLQELHLKGEVHYGLHSSDTALMTCYVHQLTEGSHIHFIDGGSGGYAIAAQQMKNQMKESSDSKKNAA